MSKLESFYLNNLEAIYWNLWVRNGSKKSGIKREMLLHIFSKINQDIMENYIKSILINYMRTTKAWPVVRWYIHCIWCSITFKFKRYPQIKALSYIVYAVACFFKLDIVFFFCDLINKIWKCNSSYQSAFLLSLREMKRLYHDTSSIGMYLCIIQRICWKN